MSATWKRTLLSRVEDPTPPRSKTKHFICLLCNKAHRASVEWRMTEHCHLLLLIKISYSLQPAREIIPKDINSSHSSNGQCTLKCPTRCSIWKMGLKGSEGRVTWKLRPRWRRKMIYDQSQQGFHPLRMQSYIGRVQPCDSRWTFCSGMNPKGMPKARLPWQLWARPVKQRRTVSEFSTAQSLSPTSAAVLRISR